MLTGMNALASAASFGRQLRDLNLTQSKRWQDGSSGRQVVIRRAILEPESVAALARE